MCLREKNVNNSRNCLYFFKKNVSKHYKICVFLKKNWETLINEWFFYINAYFSLTNTLFLVDEIDGVEILIILMYNMSMYLNWNPFFHWIPISEFFRTWKMSQMWHHKKPIRIFSDLKIVITTGGSTPCKRDVTKSYPKFFGLEKCHKCGITKNLSEFFRTWKMSRMQHHKKPIRIFLDLKNVITENCAKKAIRPHFGT